MRFDMICEANGIEHRFTKPNHPWSRAGKKTVRGTVFPRGGQVERMNRTIKEATVKRYHYDSHDQLRTHLADFMAAFNFARRLKTLSGLTPYEYICKIWTSEPDRFILNPIQQMPGLNTCRVSGFRGRALGTGTGRSGEETGADRRAGATGMAAPADAVMLQARAVPTAEAVVGALCQPSAWRRKEK